MVDAKQVELTEALCAYFERHGVSRRDFLRLLTTVGAGSALGASVASVGASAALAAPSDPTTRRQVAAASAQAVIPKILVMRNTTDVHNPDPAVGHDIPNATTQKSVYDTLLRYQGNPPELESLLAVDYQSNEDASEWTFTLDERAVFHDGTPVRASDVAYSSGRLLRKNQGPAWMFLNIIDETSVQAIDDRTVKFDLLTPFAPLPLILPWLFIVNEKMVKEHEVDGDEGEAWLLEHEAGSGPFTITRWQPGDLYEFEAVPDYWWGWPAEGRLAGYIFRIIRESSPTRLALLNGDVHFAIDLQAEDIEALSTEPGIVVPDERSFSVFSIKLNNQRGPTADVNVRKAISYAMDYEAVIGALNGRAVLLEGPLPSNLGDFHNPNLAMYRHDLDKAAEHLAQSDYPDGGFALDYVYVTGYQIEEQIGLILLDQLSRLGITVNMVPLVWPDMVARAQTAETAADMMAVFAATSYADPDNFLWQAYHSSQAGSWAAASHYNNPEFDQILEDARATPDHAERVRLYHRAQEILVEDAVEVWCQNDFSLEVVSEQVGGYRYSPIMGYYLQPLWLKD